MDQLVDHREELLLAHPSLESEMNKQSTANKKLADAGEHQPQIPLNNNKKIQMDTPRKFTTLNDHTIVRKNHWPEDADHTSKDHEDLIYLWTEDEESSNAQMRQSCSRSTPEPNPRNTHHSPWNSLTLRSQTGRNTVDCKTSSIDETHIVKNSVHRGHQGKQKDDTSMSTFSISDRPLTNSWMIDCAISTHPRHKRPE